MGKPVICCRIPFLTVEDGVDGVMVDQDPGEIATRVGEFLDRPELARSMGAAGRAKVEREYSWEAIVAKVERFYRETPRQGANA
jgi:glycosyltransferase involved in cell wall biosynthesis